MRTIKTLLQQRPTIALLALAVVFAGWQCRARAQEPMQSAALKTQQTPAGEIVWHHVGRVFLNPNTGQFVYVGYLVHIDPIGGSLFNGSPSESTAYFTFSTDLAQLAPLPNNNDVALSLVSAGTFNVYYNATPAADWSDPASFSSGKLIATFHRKESLFVQLASVSFHSLSETLAWSSNFEFGGHAYNFNRIAPNGITFAQFLGGAPQAGTTEYPVTFAGAGTVFAVGTPEERH